MTNGMLRSRYLLRYDNIKKETGMLPVKLKKGYAAEFMKKILQTI
jgi:hypothetical protein